MLEYRGKLVTCFVIFLNHLAALSKSRLCLFLTFPPAQTFSPTTPGAKSEGGLSPAGSLSRSGAGCDTAPRGRPRGLWDCGGPRAPRPSRTRLSGCRDDYLLS